MFYFIVSGYIPGTEIQLTFDMIALFVGSFGAMFLLFLVMRHIVISTQNTSEIMPTLEEISI